jgi:hypothetical protein
MVVLSNRKFLSWSLARDFLAIGGRILWRASASLTAVFSAGGPLTCVR